MRIDALWAEMEAEALTGSPNAWLTRFALAQATQPLLVGLEVASRRRALLLPLPRTAMPPRREWPDCKGLEMFAVALCDQPHLGVRLQDASCGDVFAALAEDVAPRVAAAPDARSAAAVLIGRLGRWQKFLATGTAGLSAERQRGLWGELYVMREHLLPRLGISTTIDGWRAPIAAHQDFQFSTGALEVKTTTAKQPQAVRITSERQLDGMGIASLFLHVTILDEREVGDGTPTGTETLPGMVRDLRQLLSSDIRSAGLFDDRLLEAGYLDADAHKYECRRLSLRTEHAYQVREGFPRLVEADLPIGVGDVSYALSLVACQPFAVGANYMLDTLAGKGGGNPRSASA